MQCANVSTTVRASVLALSLLLLPLTTPTFAQTTQPPPQTQRMEVDDDDNTGLWGLLGLVGLLGLAGLRRPSVKVGAYDARERSKT